MVYPFDSYNSIFGTLCKKLSEMPPITSFLAIKKD
tara:strand:- start:9165 stop:9269 length:105 start_codon:yes stop_codon:yes gene_type:complete